MKDRRTYKRYDVHKPALAYLQGIEDDVIILNISECGCCFHTERDIYALEDVITVIFVDTDTAENEEVFQFNYMVKRINKDKDGYSIGCFSRDLEGCSEYIQFLECKHSLNYSREQAVSPV